MNYALKITVGITTFNRFEYLKKLQKSLYLTDHIDSCAVCIYDDCSTEISVADLYQLFPHATEIIRRNTNLGPDRNMRQMFVDFLDTDSDILVTMDSDLICRPDWLNFTLEHFEHTNGIMSLYNSVWHKPTAKLIINGQVFLEKQHIGAAGSIMHKSVVQEIISALPPSDSYDWAWCALLRRSNKRILVSSESYFQHIGLLGANSNDIAPELGLHFNPVHDVNRMILNEYFREASRLRIQYLFRHYSIP